MGLLMMMNDDEKKRGAKRLREEKERSRGPFQVICFVSFLMKQPRKRHGQVNRHFVKVSPSDHTLHVFLFSFGLHVFQKNACRFPTSPPSPPFRLTRPHTCKGRRPCSLADAYLKDYSSFSFVMYL